MALAIWVVGLAGASVVLGLVIGRSWALLGPAVVGVMSAVDNRIEGPRWWVGLFYGGVAALGVLGGILLRRFANRIAKPS